MIRVRLAREADVPAIAAIAARTALLTEPPPPPLDWSTTVSALGAIVAVDGDRVCGFAVLWPHPDHVRIERFAVDPALRGTGIASALVDHAAATAPSGQVRLIPDAVTPGVRAFFTRRA